MDPIAIGCLARRTSPPPRFDVPVDEVRGVSGCVNEAPGGWMDRWLHNDLEVHGYRLLIGEFTKEGFDIVSPFGLELPVNRYCPVAGPYCVDEVWRRRAGSEAR